VVVDADFGYTRQRTCATVHARPLPWRLRDRRGWAFQHNGPAGNTGTYVGQPGFAFSGFNSLGNPNGSNPFLFRDNQFTGDVEPELGQGKHSTKYGFTYFHFDLNHFQPHQRRRVSFSARRLPVPGGMTCGIAASASARCLRRKRYNTNCRLPARPAQQRLQVTRCQVAANLRSKLRPLVHVAAYARISGPSRPSSRSTTACATRFIPRRTAITTASPFSFPDCLRRPR